MTANFLKSPIWKRFEKSCKALEELHTDTENLHDGYNNFFVVWDEWLTKFHALNNTVIETGSVAGINPVQNEIRNETIFAIGELSQASLPTAEKMVESDKALFDEIMDNTGLFIDTGKFLSQNISHTKACEAKVQAAEASLEKGLQNYEVLKGHLKIVTDTLEKQKELYFKVVN